jgi:hypothetical protein
MRIAVPKTTRGWAAACRRLGHECVEIPRLPRGHQLAGAVAERVTCGREALGILREQPVDLILDAFGDGLLFVDEPVADAMPATLHETLGVPLVSYWTETLRILFKEIDPALMRTAFRSPTWFKAVFTRGHLREMEWLGIDNCFYLPAGALDLPYPTEPIDPKTQTGAVLLAANQQSRYFAHADRADTRTQWPGLIAYARWAPDRTQTFLDTYRTFDLGPQPLESDDAATQAEKTTRYYMHKLFYSATLNLTQRDRFVLFLKQKLGDDFRLIGNRWTDIYGLDTEPYVPDLSSYLALLRTAPICLNMSNGDNETGLNFRHFEITATGGFLLCFDQPDLGEFFDIGRECDVFTDEDELIQKIDYYLANPEQRMAVAQAGQQRTLEQHLISHRLGEVLDRLDAGGHLQHAVDMMPAGVR